MGELSFLTIIVSLAVSALLVYAVFQYMKVRLTILEQSHKEQAMILQQFIEESSTDIHRLYQISASSTNGGSVATNGSIILEYANDKPAAYNEPHMIHLDTALFQNKRNSNLIEISSDSEDYNSNISSSSSSISKSRENRPSTVRFNLMENESNSNPAATYMPSTTIPIDLHSPIRAKYSSGPKGDLLASLKAVRAKSHIDWYDRSSTSMQCNPKETSQRVSAYLGIAPEPEPAKPAHAPPLDFKNLFNFSSDNDEANSNSLKNDGNNFSISNNNSSSSSTS